MSTTDIDQLILRHRDKLSRLLRSIVAEEEGTYTYSFSIARFRDHPASDRLDLVRRAGLIARESDDEDLSERGGAWIIIMGDRVIAESKDVGSCPSADEVLAMGEGEDRVAFLFEAPLVEEVPSSSRWMPQSRRPRPSTRS
jgi:hypothetical protein